jgi:hypothetical protein
VGNGLVGGQFWVVAEHSQKASYVFNIVGNPSVRLKLREGLRARWYTGTAHLLSDDDPRQRQHWLANQLPSSTSNAAAVRFFGTQLLTVRIDLDARHLNGSAQERNVAFFAGCRKQCPSPRIELPFIELPSRSGLLRKKTSDGLTWFREPEMRRKVVTTSTTTLVLRGGTVKQLATFRLTPACHAITVDCRQFGVVIYRRERETPGTRARLPLSSSGLCRWIRSGETSPKPT